MAVTDGVCDRDTLRVRDKEFVREMDGDSDRV